MNVLFLTINITGKEKEIFKLDFLKDERTYKTDLFDIFNSPLCMKSTIFWIYRDFRITLYELAVTFACDRR